MEATKTLKSALSTITGQLSKLKEELAETNQQISAIGALIGELRGAPISLEDWGLYLKAFIKARADAYAPGLATDLIRSYHNDPHNKRPWSAFEDDDGKAKNFLLPADLFPPIDSQNAMFFFFPDVIYERLMARFKEQIGQRWGNEEHPPLEERRKTVADLIAQRTTLLEKRAGLEAEIDEISTALHS